MWNQPEADEVVVDLVVAAEEEVDAAVVTEVTIETRSVILRWMITFLAEAGGVSSQKTRTLIPQEEGAEGLTTISAAAEAVIRITSHRHRRGEDVSPRKSSKEAAPFWRRYRGPSLFTKEIFLSFVLLRKWRSLYFNLIGSGRRKSFSPLYSRNEWWFKLDFENWMQKSIR